MRVKVENTKIPLFLIAGAAFSFSTRLMKCYAAPAAQQTNEQKAFNYALIRTRQVVENAFGKLKARWRILVSNFIRDADFAGQVPLTACVLHNICERSACPFDTKWLVDIEAVRMAGNTTQLQAPNPEEQHRWPGSGYSQGTSRTPADYLYEARFLNAMKKDTHTCSVIGSVAIATTRRYFNCIEYYDVYAPHYKPYFCESMHIKSIWFRCICRECFCWYFSISLMTLISSALRSVSLLSPSSSLLSRNCAQFSCMAYSCLKCCFWSSTFISFSSFKKPFWDSEVRFAFFPSCSLFLASECDTEGVSDCTGGVAAVDALADDVRAEAEQLSLNARLVGWAAAYRTSWRLLSPSS